MLVLLMLAAKPDRIRKSHQLVDLWDCSAKDRFRNGRPVTILPDRDWRLRRTFLNLSMR
jgi:hypothetical protein